MCTGQPCRHCRYWTRHTSKKLKIYDVYDQLLIWLKAKVLVRLRVVHASPAKRDFRGCRFALADLSQEVNELLLGDFSSDLTLLGHAQEHFFDFARLVFFDDANAGQALPGFAVEDRREHLAPHFSSFPVSVSVLLFLLVLRAGHALHARRHTVTIRLVAGLLELGQTLFSQLGQVAVH